MDNSSFHISQSEYETPRHAFELCSWINDKLLALENTSNFDKLYFERKGEGRCVKKLIEEAIPASRLALYLSVPFTDVFLTLHAGNQNYDATIERKGFTEDVFKLEITTASTKELHLRREALSRYGHVSLLGPIGRQKDGSIISEPVMVDVEQFEQKCISLMFKALLNKVESIGYPEDTAILVYLTEFHPVSIRNRAELAHKTQRYLQTKNSKRKVYYGYQVGQLVDSVSFYNI